MAERPQAGGGDTGRKTTQRKHSQPPGMMQSMSSTTSIHHPSQHQIQFHWMCLITALKSLPVSGSF